MTIGQPFNPFGLFVGAYVPNWLGRIRKLSQGAKVCYARLAQYAGQNGYCWPSQETLADELGVTPRQARDYIRELEKWELIRTEQRGLQRSNVYVFLWHSAAEQSAKIAEHQSRSGPEPSFPSGPEQVARSGPEPNLRSYRRESKEENQRKLCFSCSGTGEVITTKIIRGMAMNRTAPCPKCK